MTNKQRPKLFPPVLWQTGWRYLVRRPLQSILMILGITLGVAVIVAIDLANVSASRAFDLSVDAVAGRATHQIVGSPQGIDENLYTELRKSGGDFFAAPMVTKFVTSEALGGQPMQLLGVDPLAEAPFRDYLAGEAGIPIISLTPLFTEPNTIILSQAVAEENDLHEGDTITLTIAGYEQEARIIGLISASDKLGQRALNGIILADIATVQEMAQRIGKLDQIDLIIAEDDQDSLAQIEAMLSEDTRLEPIDARSGTIREMTAAFRLNLVALSLLALIVGMFLIYNTMTFSVVQRRPFFGTLRCLGVTRQEVFWLVVGEAFLIGVIGAILGSGLGILLGQGAVKMVTQTINDLFFVVTVRGIQIPIPSLIKGAVIGIGATTLTAAFPAWEAASIPPRTALSRSGLEAKASQAVYKVALAGLLVTLLGGGILAIKTTSVIVGFMGTFAVVIGFAMLTPAVTSIFMKLVGGITARLWGVPGRMAPRDVVKSLSRTAIAIAALMVSVSVTIGISLMVGSFRHTVIQWLEQTLQGDIYISAQADTSVTLSTPIDPETIEKLRSWHGVQQVDSIRATRIDTPDGNVQLVAIDNPNTGSERLYIDTNGPPETIWEQLQNGAVLISEPYANRFGIRKAEGTIELYTLEGLQSFPIAGIYYDYSSTQGVVMISQNVYRELWGDDTITALALRLEDGIDPDEVASDIQENIESSQHLTIRPNQALREEALIVFDRTFAITGSLQVLATVVAFIGILSTLFSLQIEKQRELGILRAIGLTMRQLWGMVMLETGLMGLIAGLLSIPTGFTLSLILIYIINRRSFGWTLQLLIEPKPFIQAVSIAVIAALLAGIYPAYRMSQTEAIDAIRFE